MSDSFIPFAVPDVGEEEAQAAAEAIRSGWLTTGKVSKAFEEEFAAYLGDSGLHAVAVNSATAGLHLALEAMGVGPGDEVLVPTWTFTASAEVIRYLGADPVFVDVDPVTLNIDLALAEKAVTERTKAIIPVHFAGLAVDARELAAFAERHRVKVLEDAAHSLPATSHGEVVGTGASDAVVFSFYATKTMTTGEGGMIVTRDEALARRARVMRLHGISRDVFDRYTSKTPSWQYEIVAPGYKYNLTDVAASIGRVQLAKSDAMADRRASLGARYDEALADLPLTLPAHSADGDRHAWHLYVLRIDDYAPVDRNTFIEQMAERGIGTSVHFIPLHRMPYWRDTYSLSDEQFPIASREAEKHVSLPIFSSMTDEQVQRVITAVREVLA
ncbi:DegT/DnrJ/EryC1/StrS aminotransferase family protein [Kytococcus sp. HMSC28H12]|uniref:DegT/DnrJ/EryC1/StrS family aminotransferase n=1 Tax=Kytococcus sp. HMSC28H12 TaxID=1581067 RepID=UPI0008A596F9|nr:DegT/DnrJ/EryC1/StrS family aminotransferase [Kytococcus sp. HMSC28H12]OFS15018.1 UDP-4-amino-4,6-dideoxy-N-acetyl-beta-L-altrosamine transaminase [Kytococcus sp. HMSC28H12]